MKKLLTLIFLSMIAFNAIHADVTCNLSDDGTLTISGTGAIGSIGNIDPKKIKNVIIENGITSIGHGVFCNCSNLSSITIPNSVVEIGFEAFYNCSSLTSMTIPNSVKTIGQWAFMQCSNLPSVTIPKSVRSIGEWAFAYCDNLASINVENGNQTYDSRDNCNAIIETNSNTLIVGSNSTVIPRTVTSIGRSAFRGCKGLKSITIPNTIQEIAKEAFYGCSGLVSITIPNSIYCIRGDVFYCCSGLTSITIPNSVTEIEGGAFSGCTSLTSITIPNSVRFMWGGFSGCTALTSITCEATVPPFCGSECFSGVDKSIPLYVPENSIDAYLNKATWDCFVNILPISGNSSLALTLTDENSDLTKGYYQKGKVTFMRNNMSIGDYATFCLPFDIDLSKMTDSFSNVYIPLNVGFLKPTGTLLLLLEEVNGNSIVNAGQIFVVKCKTSNVKFENCTAVTFGESTPNPTPANIKVYNFDGVSGALTQNTDVNLKIGGTYSNLTKLDKNNYRTLFANGSFDSTTSISPFQMYVYMESNSPVGSKITSISFDFNDEATGIKELRMNNDKQSIYNMNGQRINKAIAQKGVYIMNGKKYAK